MKQLYMRNVMAAFAAFAVFSACHNDSYETGQGAYSLMQADFVEAHTSDSGVVNRVETDEGTVLSLSQPHKASWASVADSVYRALLYYEKTNDSHGEASNSVVKVVTLSQVTTLHPKPLKQDETMSTDPVKFESMWISANGKYLNIGLYLKSDKAEEEQIKIETLSLRVREFLTEHFSNLEFEHEIKTADGYIGYIDCIATDDKGEKWIIDFKYSNSEYYLKSPQVHIYKSIYSAKHVAYLMIPKILIRLKKTETVQQFRQRLDEELSKAEIRLVEVKFNQSLVDEFYQKVKEMNNMKRANILLSCRLKTKITTNGKMQGIQTI